MDSPDDDLPPRMMDEFEQQMEDPFDFLNEYDREMELIMNPWEAENPVSKQLSMVEASIENSIVKPSAIQQEDPAPLPLSEPIRGLRSPDPPVVDESTWRGIKEPEPSIFGRIRSSKSGARGSINREDDERYCWKEHEFIKKDNCKECEFWDSVIEVCEFEDQESQEE